MYAFFEDLELVISKFERLALIEFFLQVIVVFRRRYRLQVILEAVLSALAEYTKNRDGWVDVNAHLESAHQAMLEVSSSPRREDDDQIG